MLTKPHTPKKSLLPTSIKGRRRHSQFDPFLRLPQPCSHSQPRPSLLPPKPSNTPVLEPIETFSEKFFT